MEQLVDVKKGMFDCYICRDGELNIDCADCSRKKKEGSRVIKEIMQTTDYDKLLIPLNYRGVDFNRDTLLSTHPDLTTNGKFLEYVKNLDKIHEIIKYGKIPAKSGIFIAPRTFAKITFAYSCLQHAELNGLKTFPILDTQELSRFLILSEEKPFSPIKGLGEDFSWTYEDFLTADLVFITVSKGYYNKKSYAIIEQAMDMRSRRGKSTFILSAFSLNTLTAFDNKGKSARMIDSTLKNNPQRYPAIIQFLDHTNEPNRF